MIAYPMANQESCELWGDSGTDGDLVLVDRHLYIIRPRRRRLRRILLAALILSILVLVVGHKTWLNALGHFLVYDENPRAADVILVLGGGTGERAARGAALYEEGYAPLVVTSHLKGYDLCPGTAPYLRLGREGVPRDAIRLLDNPTSTYEEAIKARALFQEMGVQRVLLVTDTYHSRRARTIFTNTFAGTDIEVISVPAVPVWFDVDAWWQRERSIQAVSQEYVKGVWYLLGLQGSVHPD